jgi:hypothetical protein
MPERVEGPCQSYRSRPQWWALSLSKAAPAGLSRREMFVVADATGQATQVLRQRLGGRAERKGSPPLAFAQDDGAFYYFAKIFRAFSNCFCCSSVTFGTDNPSDSSVSMITAATTRCVYHLLSAGTTYHGASLLAVSPIMSS